MSSNRLSELGKLSEVPRFGEIIQLRSLRRCVALLCLLLAVWSAVAVAAHHHASGTDSASCTVCIAAQSAAPEPTANLLKTTFVPIFTFHFEREFFADALIVFALSVRPPPAR